MSTVESFLVMKIHMKTLQLPIKAKEMQNLCWTTTGYERTLEHVTNLLHRHDAVMGVLLETITTSTKRYYETQFFAKTINSCY